MTDEDAAPEGRFGSNQTVAILAVILLGAVALALALGGSGIIGSDDSSGAGAFPCEDGIDNDNGGKADRDDPDCYNNPELWMGYDAHRNEDDGSNDPP